MLTIKLSRIGKKKQPVYRIIIMEKARNPRGKALEILGSYNPFSKRINLKEQRIKYWIGKGAQSTDTVYNLLVKHGIIKGKKRRISILSKKKKAKDREEKEENKKESIEVAENKKVDADNNKDDKNLQDNENKKNDVDKNNKEPENKNDEKK